MKFMRFFAAALAAGGCLAASTSASAITRLTFSGTISTPPSVQGSFPPFTVPAQTTWLASVTGGATYQYVIDYDPASTGVGGVFPISLVSGRIGSNT